MLFGLHHIHKRKRTTNKKKEKKLEEYPSKNKWIKFLDRFLIVIAFISPFFLAPQLINIWIYKKTIGVSTTTFFLLGIFNIPWVIYGIMHKEKPIIIGYSLYFIMNTLITIGTIIY